MVAAVNAEALALGSGADPTRLPDKQEQARCEVMAEIIRVMSEARARGANEVAAAMRAFPGIPGTVLGAAFVEMQREKEDAWWAAMGRNLRNAAASPAGPGVA